jgi:SAM-dependent methyltransferase/uncharacterized protein YbaR (Trm112 family)
LDATLLDILRCPFCRVSLTDDGDALHCPQCKRRFPVEKGIPLMLHIDLPGAREKLGEMEGWVEKSKAEGWYEPDDQVDRHLPYVNRDLGWEDPNWGANEVSFDVMFDRYVGDRRGLRVLEVGAAKGWAAPYWAERDCEYVATDILVDQNIGIGRGAFYGNSRMVQADGENLPFADGSFDLTYCVAALHHALDLPAMVREMARVTKPGGHVCGLNEGAKGVGRSSDNPDQAGEKELGINEHVHTVWAYCLAFTRSGLVIRRLQRSDGYPPGRLGGRIAKIPKVGETLGTLGHLSLSGYSGVSVYARKRS